MWITAKLKERASVKSSVAWVNEAVEAAAAGVVTFSVPVTSHTLRHSYAMPASR